MASEVIMPRVDMDMEEGKIAIWYVKNGDTVTKGQPLFDIETDKATMEVEAHVSGVVQGIHGEVGVMMPVGTVVAWLTEPGEAIPGAEAAAQEEMIEPVAVTAQESVEASAVAPSERAQVQVPAPATTSALLRATPLARKMARDQDIDLGAVSGSGPNGRVVAADLAAQAIQSAKGPVTSNQTLHARWLVEGAGVPLLMLHGFGAELSSWKALTSLLGSHPVLAVDLPSHGKSDAHEVHSLGDLADLVLRTLQAHGVQEFHLLGHSLGAAVALAVAEKALSRVKSVTLLAPAGLGPHINGDFIEGLCRSDDEASLKPWMAELVSDPKLLSGSFMATAVQQLASASKRAALRTLAHRFMPQGTQAHSVRHVLELLKVPTKVIWGTEDRIIPSHHAVNLPAQVALHVIRGVGHLPYVERPELVAQLVAQQLRH